MSTKYPNSECEEHYSIATSEPVCIICMANEIDRLNAELAVAREDTKRLITLADACSDLILGGECGWENMDFNEFVSLCRKRLSLANRRS